MSFAVRVSLSFLIDVFRMGWMEGGGCYVTVAFHWFLRLQFSACISYTTVCLLVRKIIHSLISRTVGQTVV